MLLPRVRSMTYMGSDGGSFAVGWKHSCRGVMCVLPGVVRPTRRRAIEVLRWCTIGYCLLYGGRR